MKLMRIILFMIKNIKSPPALWVLAAKVWGRIFKERPSHDYLDWLVEEAEDIEFFCRHIDEKIWQEANTFVAELEVTGASIVEKIPFKMGGAGACCLLYFLVRKKRPACVVETGVALGYTSATFLEALKRNGGGRLLSSDFPYPGITNSEDYIGLVVPKDLKTGAGWELLIEGDDANLPKLAALIDHIDLFHYDSDKSYSGRNRALDALESKITDSTLVVFDDIHENNHFRDYCQKRPHLSRRIFRFRNKFIGLCGEIF